MTNSETPEPKSTASDGARRTWRKTVSFADQRVTFIAFMGALLVAALVLSDVVAPELRLVRKLDRVAFHNDFEPFKTYGHVEKWAGPIKLRIHGGHRFFRAYARLHILRLRRLTGLTISEVEEGAGPADIHLYFASKKDWLKIARRHSGDSKYTSLPKNLGCYAHYQVSDDWTITRGLILIPTGISPYITLSCLLEELVQVLGLPADTDFLRPSIFSERDHVISLPLNDRILIRGFYDDRITPGMVREKALDKSRWIFRKLIAEVEEKGTDALVHPDYEPITKAERNKIYPILDEEIAKGTFLKLHQLSKQ